VGKPEGRIPVGRPRYSCEDNIKMDLRDKWFEGMDSIELSRDVGPVEGSYEYCNEPSDSIQCWEILE
jgi:hypothetical protein